MWCSTLKKKLLLFSSEFCQLIIQLFEEGHWHHPGTNEKCRLENVDMIGMKKRSAFFPFFFSISRLLYFKACSSLDSSLYGDLPARLVARCCVLRVGHPNDDALNRFFSTTLTKQFRVQSTSIFFAAPRTKLRLHRVSQTNFSKFFNLPRRTRTFPPR